MKIKDVQYILPASLYGRAELIELSAVEIERFGLLSMLKARMRAGQFSRSSSTISSMAISQ